MQGAQGDGRCQSQGTLCRWLSCVVDTHVRVLGGQTIELLVQTGTLPRGKGRSRNNYARTGAPRTGVAPGKQGRRSLLSSGVQVASEDVDGDEILEGKEGTPGIRP